MQEQCNKASFLLCSLMTNYGALARSRAGLEWLCTSLLRKPCVVKLSSNTRYIIFVQLMCPISASSSYYLSMTHSLSSKIRSSRGGDGVVDFTEVSPRRGYTQSNTHDKICSEQSGLIRQLTIRTFLNCHTADAFITRELDSFTCYLKCIRRTMQRTFIDFYIRLETGQWTSFNSFSS